VIGVLENPVRRKRILLRRRLLCRLINKKVALVKRARNQDLIRAKSEYMVSNPGRKRWKMTSNSDISKNI